MKAIKTIFATLAATAVLAGCAKEITSPSFENDKVNSEGSRVIAVSFAPQTKTELDGFQPKFVDNDSILISNGVAIDTCEVKVESEVATISTNLTGPLTAVYPYKAAKMNENDENLIDTVLVSTEQDGTFASANICMAKMTDGNEESLSFENKTAVFCIKPAAGASPEYVEVSAEGFNIANDYPEGSTFTTCNTIHVAPITTDSVYVSILVPNGLKVNNLKFSDGTQEKAITTGARAAEAIAAGTLYTVAATDWESPEADIPDGALKGVFSVSADKQVYFSRGNLVATIDADGSPTAWKFHAHQYDTLGCGGANTSIGTAAGDIDLFGWSTANTTYGINTSDSDVDYSGNFIDWGKAIEDSNTWRTLTTEEWQYLFSYTSYDEEINPTGMDYRNDKRESKYKYGVTVCGKANCVVLLPDNWDSSVISLNSFAETLEYSGTTTPTWQQMEDAGAVCLPAAGYREGTSTIFVGDYGIYWSSTARGLNDAHNVCFYSEDVLPSDGGARFFGLCVRLVTDVSATPTPTEYVEIKALYNGAGSDSTTLKWYRQNLAITDSGKKPWKGEKTSAVKVPGTNEDVIVGDYFQWAAYAGYCGDATATDKGLLIYDSFTNNKCVDGGSEDSIALKSAGGSKKYRFSPSNTTGYTGISPYFSTGYQYYKDTDHSTLYRETSYTGHSDDVANIILGGDWRMPTSTEFKAMREATYWAWDGTDCGYYVFKPGEGTSGTANDRGNFNATNDEKSKALLFFPAAGYGDYISLSQAGSSGRYWSSTLSTDNIAQAYYLLFKSDDVFPQRGNFRFNGCSIRPVSD